MKKILILSANPTNTNQLRLDQEVREIQAALDQCKNRDEFEIITRWAVRVDDLQPILLDHTPDIVHFSGHGGGSQGLALENELGQMQLVSSTALAGLFKLFKAEVECVFLNACYSEEQAKAIYQHINCVVGMNQAIGDIAAIKFAKGFYRALGTDRTYKEAFEFGCNLIDLQSIPESSTPVIKQRKPTQARRKQVQSDQVKAVSPTTNTTRVFISYRSQSPDRELAQQFFEALTAAGHESFMAGESIRLGETWPVRIDTELEQSDYFLLLLSEQSAVSEMVTEEVRRVKRLRDTRTNQRPIILPIRVNFPMNSPLNYDLRGYLQNIQQRRWQSPADTPVLIQEVLTLLSTGHAPAMVASEPVIPHEDSPDQPPLPVAEPELYREPGGSVPLSSGLYVERPPKETDCYREIVQPGALIRIKAPRQMGKTSLMARVLNHAKEQGYQAIPISFQRADNKLFTDLDQFLHWFCVQIGRRVKRLNQLEDYWKGDNSKDKCITYLEECILEEIDSPIVLGLDEVDLVFPHREVADDFFGLLRSWYESARYGDASSDLWAKLRLVVVHSTEAYIPLNINQSPFNVGMTVELPEFNQTQVQDLAQRYGLTWGGQQVEQLVSLVGGHPYLVRKALYHLRRRDVTLEQLLSEASTEAGIYIDHLRRHLLNLQRYPELTEALRQVVIKSKPTDLNSKSAFKLESMGLVSLQGNQATIRCDLYRSYFRDHLQDQG
ncbi:MAG: AAA-like domain-containing protein [Nostoc sp. JL34]|uniref:AAA-like domain-containing protein n=1 Tax=Nostoc sp. JL34 TaxID=2815397 RepID=UPI001E12D711|nr:AAA-like domain-containing protein [Nostoc sp. JL34]MBN3884483.1 AAA-like domain-containing protein [Nostoc sp. JL34]